MPHLVIEYSAGTAERVDIASLCRAAHQAMADNPLLPHAGIRIRAYRADYSIVADGLDENDFLAMTLSVGAGRSTEDLKAAGQQIFDVVRGVLRQPLSTAHFAFSLEIREIDPVLSWKDTPIHERLSRKDQGTTR